MATLEQALGSGANATVRNGTIEKVMDGMARYYRDPDEVRNPSYDPRSRVASGAGGVKQYSNLYRGYISHLRPEVFALPGASGKKLRHVRFQYNPTQIALNYSIDTSNIPQQSRPPDDPSPVLATTAQTMSFTLYFNRTYETLTGDKKVGVMADIQSLEYLLGSYDSSGMQAVECVVCFGMTKSGKPLAFAGWISDLNVEFLQFTHRMIPTVAMVQVGLVRRFIGSHVPPSTEDATGTTTGEKIEDFFGVRDASEKITDFFTIGSSSTRTSAPASTTRGGVTLPGPLR